MKMKMNEILISHWRGSSLGALLPRYYNGVLFRRTTISCVAAAFLIASFQERTRASGVTFPLEVKWSAALPASPAYGPAFDSERAYIALRTNQLIALQLTDGKVVWSVECPMNAAPAAGDGLVFSSSDDLIEARAAADGRPQWRRPIKGKVLLLHWDSGWLLASTEAGPLLALRATDGEILWQRDLGSPLQGLPAPAGDRIYVPLKDGRILALSLSSGEDIWTQKLTEPAEGILPVGDRVFVGGRDNHLRALDASDGDTDWKWPTGADVLGIPVLDERRVYFVALDNILRGHHRGSGSMLWKRVLPMRPFTGPLLSGQTLIMPGVASELRAYNATDGKPIAHGEFIVKGAENEEMLLAAPPFLTAQDLIVLVTKGGQVRGVGSKPEGAPPPAPPSEAAPPTETPEILEEPDAAGNTAPAVP
jgi:outer membrane protein assembly factor BamB